MRAWIVCACLIFTSGLSLGAHAEIEPRPMVKFKRGCQALLTFAAEVAVSPIYGPGKLMTSLNNKFQYSAWHGRTETRLNNFLDGLARFKRNVAPNSLFNFPQGEINPFSIQNLYSMTYPLANPPSFMRRNLNQNLINLAWNVAEAAIPGFSIGPDSTLVINEKEVLFYKSELGDVYQIGPRAVVVVWKGKIVGFVKSAATKNGGVFDSIEMMENYDGEVSLVFVPVKTSK